jgi:hypothetical protein
MLRTVPAMLPRLTLAWVMALRPTSEQLPDPRATADLATV